MQMSLRETPPSIVTAAGIGKRAGPLTNRIQTVSRDDRTFMNDVRFILSRSIESTFSSRRHHIKPVVPNFGPRHCKSG